jgi:L-ribulokinase
VGDLFKWWVLGVCRGDTNLHAELMREAAQLRPGQSGLLALDWNSGSRTIPVDPLLTGLLLGQTLHTTQAEIYRALIEATAFGARAIMERIGEYSVPMNRVVCAGALAEKNPLLMQIYADVTGCTMQLAGSPHASALGAAVSAAVLVRAHPDFPSAQSAMTSLRSEVFSPEPENHRIYDRLYALYRALHDAFGGMSSTADLTRVMRELIEIRQAQAH